MTKRLCIYAITEASRQSGRSQGGGSSSQVMRSCAPWCRAATDRPILYSQKSFVGWRCPRVITVVRFRGSTPITAGSS